MKLTPGFLEELEYSRKSRISRKGFEYLRNLLQDF